MPLPFRPRCQATHLGPLPHPTASAAWAVVLQHMPGLPALPLLVNQGEELAWVSAEGFAGAQTGNTEIVLDRRVAEHGLDTLYAGYLRGKGRCQSIELAAMPSLLPSEQTTFRRSRVIWALVLGPVSLALMLIDDQNETVLNDAQLVDAFGKHIFLRRAWIQTVLERMGKPSIVWVYEPYLNVATSAFRPLTIPTLFDAVEQALGTGRVRALWLPDAPTAAALQDLVQVDVLGLPLPDVDRAAEIGPVIQQQLAVGGAIGWGIVPVTAEGLRSATVGRLAARFESWLRGLEAAGLPVMDVLAASLIMPEDTLAYLEVAEAERALGLTVELSSLIRQSYGVD